MRYLYIYIILSLSSMIMSCNDSDQKTPTINNPTAAEVADDSTISISDTQFKSSGFLLGKIAQRPFNKSLNVHGTIDLPARSVATVSTMMPGTVGPYSVIQGQWVRRGQVLFSIANPELVDLQQEYLETTAQQRYLQSEHDRLQGIVDDQIVSIKEYSKIVADLEKSKITAKSIAQKLQLFGIDISTVNPSNLKSAIAITAPQSGYITQIHATQGSYLDATMPAMRISATHQIYAELSVLEAEAYHLKVGQSVQITLPDGQTARTKISLISPLISEEHIIMVRCELPSEVAKTVPPGMSVRATIEIEGYTAWSLPQEAICDYGDDEVILVEISHAQGQRKYEIIPVQTGATSDGHIEITSDAALNDKSILIKGCYYLMP